MLNVLLPAMGNSVFFRDYFFPKLLTEINGKTMLEHVVDNYNCLSPKNYIFVFNDDDCKSFHLDSSAKILTPVSKFIKLKKQTAGALCTCLMAIDHINNALPLLIANSDQVINVDYRDVINYFDNNNFDSGVIVFPNIHPRWSYAKIFENEVVEVAEKRPISKNAVAGFYYFKHGRDFVDSAKKALLKQNNLEGKYYISASVNEMILMGKKVGYYRIDKDQYKSFYSPEKIKEYEDCFK